MWQSWWQASWPLWDTLLAHVWLSGFSALASLFFNLFSFQHWVTCSPFLCARFLSTMKQNALQGVVPSETEDLNVEHLQLLLLIFHNFSEKGRRAIFTMLVQNIQELSVNMDVQMRSVPLTLARLLLIFDYLLHQYSKAPMYLFEQVKTHTISLLSFWELHSLAGSNVLFVAMKALWVRLAKSLGLDFLFTWWVCWLMGGLSFTHECSFSSPCLLV